MSYLVWKLLHVVSVVAFLGNITTGLLWAELAHRSGDPRLVAAAFRGISASDRWFTVPGVIGLVATGAVAAMQARLPILGTGWILWSIGLLAASGMVFGARLAPLQRRIAALAEGPWDAASRAGYERCFRAWKLWGAIALVTPFAALAIMVLKPNLPAF